jgi:D-beta-D-heptose 7-phosphate kinase/D-beta-D-heptose 1-phosphate adenosyltransferase
VTDLLTLVDDVARLRVLVVGDAVLDVYLRGTAGRIGREAPVPVVDVQHRDQAPGGAANVAVNARALGAAVDFLTVVGVDHDADLLCAGLTAAGVSTQHVLRDASRRTATKQRLLADGHMLVRFDEGAPTGLSPATAEDLLRRLDSLAATADVIIVSDYGYGVLSDQAVRRLRRLQQHRRDTGRVLVADARCPQRYRDVEVTAVKASYAEAAPLLRAAEPAGRQAGLEAAGLEAAARPQTGSTGGRADAVIAGFDRLPTQTGADIVAVTLDRDGAVVCQRGRPPYRTHGRPTTPARASGAGDAYTVGLALGLGAGAAMPMAAELAAAVAAGAVGRDVTSACSLADLREVLLGSGTCLVELERLVPRIAFLRRQGTTVVFTNGCFDILHSGHVEFLNRAKAQGDVLVVGLNGDDSIRALKGPDRPVNPLADRAQVLAALTCVDHVVAFDAPTAVELIERLRPHIYVKGGDYTPGMLPETPAAARVGAEVRILPYTEARSTTDILARIRATPVGPG